MYRFLLNTRDWYIKKTNKVLLSVWIFLGKKSEDLFRCSQQTAVRKESRTASLRLSSYTTHINLVKIHNNQVVSLTVLISVRHMGWHFCCFLIPCMLFQISVLEAPLS